MNCVLQVRGDSRAVARVMRELGFDELAAMRHVDQLKTLRARLREQRRAQAVAAINSLSGRL